MRIAVYQNTPLEEIPKKADAIHLVRPLGKKKLERIIAKCNCREVSVSKSCWKRLAKKTRELLQSKGLKVKVESKPGRAISLPLEKMLHAIELHKDFQSFREIERLTQIPKSTAHYLVKYAQREKIKKGNTTIYLK